MGGSLEQQYDVASTKQALGCHSYRRDGRDGYESADAVVAYRKLGRGKMVREKI